MGFRDRVLLYCVCVLATSFIVSNMLLPMWRNRSTCQAPAAHDDSVPYDMDDYTPPAPTIAPPWYRPHSAVPRPTRIVNHAPGWTIFENLYMSNGTFFVVTDLPPENLPQMKFVISSNFSYDNFDFKSRHPTEKNIRYISTAEAARRWTLGVWGISGNTFIFHYPPVTLLRHYYHACAETFLGAWRFWSGTYDPAVSPAGYTTAPPIHRVIFTYNSASEWKDLPGLNAFFLFTAWPSISIEEREQWADRTYLTRNGDKAWVYDRVMLNDRAAASRGPIVYPRERKIAAEAYEATLETSSPFWWEPVRRSVLQFSGIDQETLNIALNPEEAPVVTYVSRNGGKRRMLRSADHDRLVAALEELCGTRGWELNILDAQDLPPEEQLQVFARTTILLGVHGNGLTHMLFMPPTPKATVIEIFYPGGLAYDYEWPARRALRFKHFAVWNDTWYTYPHPPHVKLGFPEGVDGDGGFQGNNIPVHAETVARIVEMRLDGEL